MIGTRVVQATLLATALLTMAACGSDSADSFSKPKSASCSPSDSGSGGAAQIKDASSGQWTVRDDHQVRVHYIFKPNNQGDSDCNDQCAAAWTPKPTNGAPTAGNGADKSLLGTTTRKDGTTQLTYNKHPLYTFAF